MKDRNSENIAINEEEIDFSNKNNNIESSLIKVSTVVDINKLDREEYLRISNMLLAIMNCNDEKSFRATINMKYGEEEKRLRSMLWAGLDLRKVTSDRFKELVLEINKGGNFRVFNKIEDSESWLLT